MAQPEHPDEFARIAELFAPLAAEAPAALGLRDDAALLQPAVGTELVLTVDAIVEGVHFLPDDPPGAIARKLIRVNLSDLAAKGATPKGYLLVTAWRSDTSLEWMRAFAAGLAQDQAEFDIALWGGDTVSTPGPLTFSLTAIGEVPQGSMLRRAGAKQGDQIFVTGTLGDGALGLVAAKGELPGLTAELRAQLIDRYRLPQPRVALGPKLRGVATASLDVSDGLLADLGHLCRQSATGARVKIESLPLSEATSAALRAEPGLRELILAGGDDYEILFAAPAEKAGELARFAAETGIAISRIGEMTPFHQGVLAVTEQGEEIIPKHLGFRHF